MENSLDFSMNGAKLRQMQNSDIPNVIRIETAAHLHHWTNRNFLNCLEIGYDAWILCKEADLIGYGVMSIVVDEAHILNLCISPEYQRQGYGRQILLHLLTIARAKKVDTVFLEVRSSNQIALNLYLKQGFNQIAVRKNYYPLPNSREKEDACILALTLF
jgi:ribosomal-protein-alanine N-acetyltransferase